VGRSGGHYLGPRNVQCQVRRHLRARRPEPARPLASHRNGLGTPTSLNLIGFDVDSRRGFVARTFALGERLESWRPPAPAFRRRRANRISPDARALREPPALRLRLRRAGGGTREGHRAVAPRTKPASAAATAFLGRSYGVEDDTRAVILQLLTSVP
jgi:hypothetical protein